MAIGDIVPWRWGGLRRSDRDTGSFPTFRRDMEALHREMDRLFEGLFGEAAQTLPQTWPTALVPKLDMSEDEKAFTVSVDLPGMEQKNVEITLLDGVLTIRGQREEDKETKEKDFYRRERASGSFRRSLEMPAAVDAAKVEATFKNGVLTIVLPKTKEAQEKVTHVAIKAA